MRLNGIFLILWMFYSAAVGCTFLLLPIGLLRFLRLLPASVYWPLVNRIQASYMGQSPALLELLGVPYTVYTGPGGKQELPDGVGHSRERALWIANHRGRVDWLFLFPLCTASGVLHLFRIVLKQQLQLIPYCGQAMRMFGFVYLSRDWAADKPVLERDFDRSRTRGPEHLLLFPEGTDLSPSNRRKDDAFARSRGWPVYQHVLHPRFKGFQFAVGQFAPDVVYDVTLAYADPVPQNEACIVRGQLSSGVHVHVRRFSVNDILQRNQRHHQTGDSDDDGDNRLNRWLTDRWNEKEARLAEFASNGKFTGQPQHRFPVRQSVAWYANLVAWFCFMCAISAAFYSHAWLFYAYFVPSSLFFCSLFKFFDVATLSSPENK